MYIYIYIFHPKLSIIPLMPHSRSLVLKKPTSLEKDIPEILHLISKT